MDITLKTVNKVLSIRLYNILKRFPNQRLKQILFKQTKATRKIPNTSYNSKFTAMYI